MSHAVLNVVVSSVSYYISQEGLQGTPPELWIDFFISHHPCDDEPYISDVGFPSDAR